MPAPRIFLSAGEASGDHYGAALITALRHALPAAEFTGLGGLQMQRAGQRRIIRAEDVAVMGLTEVLRHLPRVYASYCKLVRSIRSHPPQLAVLIDYPDVNLRLARHLHRAGVPVVYLVSPQLWAWKQKRLLQIQQRVSRMLVIFPFEADYYRARGVEVEFIGHPLADAPAPAISREALAAQSIPLFGGQRPLDPAKPWIALLPGSRLGEIRRTLPPMLAAALLGNQYEFILPVAHTLTPEQLRAIPFNGVAPPRIGLVHDAAAALLHSRAAIVASGTATVQAALLGCPFVIVYKTSALTYAIARRAVRYPAEIPAPLDELGNPPVGMVNLIAGRRIVPELLQARCTPPHIVAALRPLLADTPERAAMLAALDAVRLRLQPTGEPAIQRAAAAVLALLPR